MNTTKKKKNDETNNHDGINRIDTPNEKMASTSCIYLITG